MLSPTQAATSAVPAGLQWQVGELRDELSREIAIMWEAESLKHLPQWKVGAICYFQSTRCPRITARPTADMNILGGAQHHSGVSPLAMVVAPREVSSSAISSRVRSIASISAATLGQRGFSSDSHLEMMSSWTPSVWAMSVIDRPQDDRRANSSAPLIVSSAMG